MGRGNDMKTFADYQNSAGYADPTAYQAINNIMKEPEYKRGDIVFVRDYRHTTGSEQDAVRPAVIVSNDKGNFFAPIVEVVFLTTQEKKPLPTHTTVMCKIPSTALCEQITTVSKERISEYIRTCTKAEMQAIDRCMRISLELAEKSAVDDCIREKLTEYEKLEEKGLIAVIECNCKDCKHWVNGPGCSENVKICEYGNYYIGAKGFCYFAERKEGH